MKTHWVQLERYDDVTSVADKIAWSRANRVLLVWPRRGRVLERYLDLVLIQRACQEIGAQLAFLVADELILDHAQELGIPVFRSVKTAQRMLWRRSRQKKIFEPKGWRPRAALEEQQRAARTAPAGWVQNFWLRLSIFLLGVGAVVLAMLLVLPEARIGLSLAQDPQALELPVYASPELAQLNLSGGLPVQYLSMVLEGQDEQPATGAVLIGDKAALGTVKFSNLTNQAVVIAAGTRVLTSGDPAVQFETQREVRLPAKPGSTGEATVQALQTGSKGNVAAGAIQGISGEVGAWLKVTNPAATVGGRDLMTTAVSAEDGVVLRERLTAALQQKALVEVQAKLLPGVRLFPETLQAVKVLREQQIPASGAAAESVSLALQVEFRVWTIREADLEALVEVALDANLPAGTMGLEGSLRVSDSQAPVLDQGQMRWQIRARRVVQASWSDRGVILAVAGHSVEDARQALQQQFRVVGPPVIEMTPAWWPLFPLLPGRITVVVQ